VLGYYLLSHRVDKLTLMLSLMGLPLVVYGPMVLGNPWYFHMVLYVMKPI
jgi:hypothetical protein